jgi:hypothetical protein
MRYGGRKGAAQQRFLVNGTRKSDKRSERRGLTAKQMRAYTVKGGVRGMKESTTYRAILEEGAAKGKRDQTRNLILRIGSKHFGPPDARVQKTLKSIASLKRLEQIADRLLEAESWEDLLA